MKLEIKEEDLVEISRLIFAQIRNEIYMQKIIEEIHQVVRDKLKDYPFHLEVRVENEIKDYINEFSKSNILANLVKNRTEELLESKLDELIKSTMERFQRSIP